MSVFEIIAILLAAFFVCVPLGVTPTENLINALGYSSTQNNPSNGGGDLFEILTLILAAINVGVLIFQAFIFHRQRRLMERQADIAREQADISATQILVAERLERALLLQTPPEFGFMGYRDHPDKSIFPDMEIGFTNHGRSPAIINFARIIAVISREPPERVITTRFWHILPRSDVQLPVFYTDFFWTDPSVAPGETTRTVVAHPSPLRPDQIDELGTGNQRLWVDGVVFYTDIFGKDRETNFRWVYDYTIDMLIQDGGQLHNRYT